MQNGGVFRNPGLAPRLIVLAPGTRFNWQWQSEYNCV